MALVGQKQQVCGAASLAARGRGDGCSLMEGGIQKEYIGRRRGRAVNKCLSVFWRGR